MSSPSVTLREAADRLADTFSPYEWVVSVGMGTPDKRETLYLYVKTLRHKELAGLEQGYLGYPVRVEKTGGARPAASGRRR